MPAYMLLLHENPADLQQPSPEALAAVIAESGAWAGKLAEAGRLVESHKLKDEPGRHLTGSGSDLAVVDGPFAETKELIGGYFVINADDYDHATELCRDCPHLTYGGRIELREVDLLEEAAATA